MIRYPVIVLLWCFKTPCVWLCLYVFVCTRVTVCKITQCTLSFGSDTSRWHGLHHGWDQRVHRGGSISVRAGSFSLLYGSYYSTPCHWRIVGPSVLLVGECGEMYMYIKQSTCTYIHRTSDILHTIFMHIHVHMYVHSNVNRFYTQYCIYTVLKTNTLPFGDRIGG